MFNMNTPNGLDEVIKVFGDPRNADGTLNESWEGQNIRRVPPPPQWQLYYQDDRLGLVRINGIRMHRLVADTFVAVLDDVFERAREEVANTNDDDKVRQFLHQKRMDENSGGFNFRSKVGAKGISMHSFGIAIDWDADHNPQQKRGEPLRTTFPDWWFQTWNKHGWVDGRNFPRRDPMHVQFASGV
jgi:D-alanyl-D-alanine carboxypeptidase